MIADLNEGSPEQVRYIHWRSTGSDFQVMSLFCYEKKRMYASDMSSTYWYILPKNGGIPNPSSCSYISSGNQYINYDGDHTIWRLIIYNAYAWGA